MPSLRQLLRDHAPFLLIDSASEVVHAAVGTGPDAPLTWARRAEEAGSGVFTCVEEVLAATGLSINDLRGYLVCEGPGSSLGIRTAVMAVRTWRVLNPAPIFTYQSLPLVSTALARPGLAVISDARRDSWHVTRDDGPIHRVPTTGLSGPLAMPAGFRHWTPLPADVEPVSYDLPALFAATLDRPLFHENPEPDSFQLEAPTYATWTPVVHQAPRSP